MTKTDKKIDKQICQALTRVCETVKIEVEGFQWLTHFVDYNQFPSSLSVICIFSSKDELEKTRKNMKDQFISELIKTELEQINIKLKNINQHILFNTENDFKSAQNKFN